MKKRAIALTFAILSVLMMATGTALQAKQQQLAKKLIRLHVVANSDTREDQAIKLEVRDAVLQAANTILQDAEDPKSALAAGLDEIGAAAGQRLRSLGCDARVSVRLGKEVFPTREYDTFSLPAGVYESLRITIGQAQGHNWWCVVFPSICLTASMDELEQAAQTAGLTEAELRLITGKNDGYVLKFKTLELLQKLKQIIFG